MLDLASYALFTFRGLSPGTEPHDVQGFHSGATTWGALTASDEEDKLSTYLPLGAE